MLSGQLSSTTAIRIHVSDVNDNRPILNDFILLVDLFEDEVPVTQIGMIPALMYTIKEIMLNGKMT
ncbi:hypothetical protein DICVIV_05941 [Dictyocaulus viviparus]|uniref:CELSR1-3-like ninth cadherin domain-containing protein n=1 Tax=Dictyocaulus viviparus TaxID=29172 RepID=A0A0D8XTW4_DICVI|nr:hypothetical protein DICVIV_05941 [Dictyocaulus viviparus]